MYEKLKIIHHSHTGRLKPHEFTSYLPLAFMVFITGVVLLIATFPQVSASDPPPQSGSIGLTGVVPSPPPKTPAVILSPTNNQHFKTSPITVSGTCPSGTLVEIYKNNIFAGSAQCDSSGRFAFDIDLLFGQNVITALVYDALNQAGPASNSVTVYFDSVLPPNSPLSLLNLGGEQLLLNTNAVYRGAFPDQMLNVPVSIIGGTPPYAVTVEWGDSNDKVIPRSNNETFNAGHAYKKPGTFQITLKGVDSQQRTAFLTVAAIINGQPAALVPSASTLKHSVNKILMLWPIYTIAVTTVISFWLGERREKRILGKTLSAQRPPLGTPAPQP
ncbi:MAG TPA: PKD domain-containing protein [Candidatus Saccharimonadales bacterium]|nr:PKD domain-containing protein [Candidatus Saccharimonadales bacterium]